MKCKGSYLNVPYVKSLLPMSFFELKDRRSYEVVFNWIDIEVYLFKKKKHVMETLFPCLLVT